MGFTIRGFIWDIPVLIVAYVLFSGLRSISPGEGSGFPLKIPHLKQAERWVAVTLNLDLKTLPIGSIVVPFWDYFIGFLNMNHQEELLWSLWVNPKM